MMKFLLLSTIFALLIRDAFGTCEHTDEVCEYYIEIEQRLTMMKEKDLVYISSGYLYKYDVSYMYEENAVPIAPEDVITADGYREPRVVAVVNGTMPGPEIIAFENQWIVINVQNNLVTDSLSIHFHGLPQVNTPWMDGASFITQCPILPGQSFSYRIRAHPAGTYYYHAHSGTQTAMGIFGAFIVRRRHAPEIPEHVLVIQSWNHKQSADKDAMQAKYGVYIDGKPANYRKLPDGSHVVVTDITSALINGRGRIHYDNGSHNQAPLTTLTVKKGETNRLRIITACSNEPYVISIDEHEFDVIAVDSRDIEPTGVHMAVLNSGERIDIVLKANQAVGNYWIRASTLAEDNIVAEAILHYEGSEIEDPGTFPVQCTEQQQCKVLNCPFKRWPNSNGIKCISLSELRQSKNEVTPVPDVVPGQFKEYFLNLVFLDNVGFVNGKSFQPLTISALTQPSEYDSKCENAHCNVNVFCFCSPSLTIGNGDTVQFVVSNIRAGDLTMHPIHMHGHHFHVLKIGYPKYDSNGKIIGHNMDIECEGDPERTRCNNPTWTNKSWFYGNIPGINTDRAPRKDTMTIPPGGYVVIRIKADNPGLWALHCHIETHFSGGMNILLNESFSEIPEAPEGFPVCRNFKTPMKTEEIHTKTTASDDNRAKHGMRPYDSDDGSMTQSYHQTVVFVLIGVILIQFLIAVIVFGCVFKGLHRHKNLVKA